MKKKQECEGCKQYRYEMIGAIFCKFPLEKDGHECPCLTCLVKGMCDDWCQPFKDYMAIVWGPL